MKSSVPPRGLTLWDDEPDDPQFNENHAELLGLPPYENPLEAEDAATPLGCNGEASLRPPQQLLDSR